jgi:hypothetical protein
MTLGITGHDEDSSDVRLIRVLKLAEAVSCAA